MKRSLSMFSAFVMLSTTLMGQLKTVAYADGTQKLNGQLAMPKAPVKKKAGVLILPAWMGIDDHSKNSAEKLAAQGYYAFVADIYGEGQYPTDKKTAGDLAGYYKNHVDEYQKRIRLALAQLIKSGADSNNIVVIGYCFGGTGALEAARANMPVKGVVCFHGGLARDTAKAMTPITSKVLVCHGANDRFVPDEQIKAFQVEMNIRKADWQMIYYSDAVHAFTEVSAGNDPGKGTAYNEKATKRSWALMLQFLAEAFS